AGGPATSGRARPACTAARSKSSATSCPSASSACPAPPADQGQLVKAAPFEYHAPQTLDEALALLAEFGDEAKVLAGGQSLWQMLRLRLCSFASLIGLNPL